MDVDDKNILLSFLNNEIDYYEFTLDQLNRTIRNVLDGKYVDKISSGEPTMCDLCYIALKIGNPEIKLRTRIYNRNLHAKYMYVDDFNRYITTLKRKKELRLPERSSSRFPPSTWYLYVNVFDKDTGLRSTGRRVLKFIQNGPIVRIEYFTSDIALSDWSGDVPADLDEEFIVFNLKTTRNNDRRLDIWLRVGLGDIPPVIHGELSFTTKTGSDICHPPIVMEKVEGGMKAEPAVIKDGADKSIKEIELFLINTANKNVVNYVPLHQCGNEINKNDQ